MQQTIKTGFQLRPFESHVVGFPLSHTEAMSDVKPKTLNYHLHFFVGFSNYCTYSIGKQVLYSINNHLAVYIFGMFEMYPGYFCHCLWVGG